MEVYQSSKTAAEMEYALSAVPSIGANGNWFIGEQDTGIFSAGVNVSGAAAGQFIKVAAVDENGRPTAWEPAEIKGGDTWEFINKVTCQSDVSDFCVNVDENGNPFTLKKIMVHIHHPAVDTITTGLATRISLASSGSIGYYGAFAVGSNPIKGNTGKKIFLYAECIDDKIVLVSGKYSMNNNAAMDNLSNNIQVDNGGWQNGTAITRVAYGSYQVVVGAGTAITIYGVRQ